MLATMAICEVREVSFSPERTDRLLGFEIDSPAAGTGTDHHVLHVVGWAVGRDSEAVSIEVLEGDRLLRTVPVRGPRADVASTLGAPAETDCVFHVLVSLLGLRLETELTLTVVLSDASRVPAARLGLLRQPVDFGYAARIRPVMVTTAGRSGSTWLMQMLASHPQIVVFRRFPFESAPAKYWLHALRVMSEPANFVESAQPNGFDATSWWLGNNPYHDDRVYEQDRLSGWFARTHLEELAAAMKMTIDSWYRKLAEVQAQPDVTLFAEKHMWPHHVSDLTWEVYPRGKEIFLVRDFRDMALSILAFDERRGYAGFGRPEGVSDEDYLRGELQGMADDLARAWRARRDRAHLVRYEDLVLEPQETVTAMLDYLEVDSSRSTVDSVIAHGAEQILSLPGFSYEPAEVAAHRTQPDLSATVGRWRREEGERLRERSERIFEAPLRELGYT
jgi:hypothetical protein